MRFIEMALLGIAITALAAAILIAAVSYKLRHDALRHATWTPDRFIAKCLAGGGMDCTVAATKSRMTVLVMLSPLKGFFGYGATLDEAVKDVVLKSDDVKSILK